MGGMRTPCAKTIEKVKLIIGASGFGFVRSTIKRQTPLVECLSFYDEANALISELFFISSNSSLVGTVTGSFLKLKVITSLSLDNNDLFSPNTSFQAWCARLGTSRCDIALPPKKITMPKAMKSASHWSKFSQHETKNTGDEKSSFFIFPKGLDFAKFVWYCVCLPRK